MISGETLYPDLRSHLFSFLNRRFFVRFFFNVGKVYLVIPRTVGSFRESGLVRLRDKQLKTSWPNPHTILLYLLIRGQIDSQFCLPWVWFWNDTHNRLHNLPCIYSNLYCDEKKKKAKTWVDVPRGEAKPYGIGFAPVEQHIAQRSVVAFSVSCELSTQIGKSSLTTYAVTKCWSFLYLYASLLCWSK